MAYLKLHRKKLKHNYQYLNDLFKKNDIHWDVVTKCLCGNETFLNEVKRLGVKRMHDARVDNIKKIKNNFPEIETSYIKPPPKRSVKNIVKYADISFNTEFSTIKMLSDEAKKQSKTHKIIIMIEMGDLREGVMGNELLDFYSKVFKLPNIEVIGVGASLDCLNGVLPTRDKLIQLSLYKQLIELKFDKKIPLVSGGSSVMIPLIFQQQLPKGINHFRVGETLFFGNNLITGDPIKEMEQDVFELYARIIELKKKPKAPYGPTGKNVMGEEKEINEEHYGKQSYRAIVDVGQLDITPKFLKPKNKNISVVGASSDMLVMDLGKNSTDYKVGDVIQCNLKYMGTVQLMNSRYIDKTVDNE